MRYPIKNSQIALAANPLLLRFSLLDYSLFKSSGWIALSGFSAYEPSIYSAFIHRSYSLLSGHNGLQKRVINHKTLFAKSFWYRLRIPC